MIAGTTTDYTGRLLDIQLLNTIVVPDGIHEMRLSILAVEPKMVTGIQKLIQRYAILFLTSLEDIKYDPNTGTTFLPAMFGGAINSPGRLTSYFAVGNSNVVSILKKDIVGLPDDEILVSADLTDYNIDYARGWLYLRVTIINKAGDSTLFVVPAAITTV